MANVTRIFESGLTTRYHTENPVLRQCVAPHAWGVAMLIATCHPNPSPELFKAALLHDAAERRGPGDIRYQAKRDNHVLREAAVEVETTEFKRLGIQDPELNLDGEEMKWLKWADMAEVALYTRNLWQDCGYPCALEVFGEAVEVIEKRVGGLGIKAFRITDELSRDYRKAVS